MLPLLATTSANEAPINTYISSTNKIPNYDNSKATMSNSLEVNIYIYVFHGVSKGP